MNQSRQRDFTAMHIAMRLRFLARAAFITVIQVNNFCHPIPGSKQNKHASLPFSQDDAYMIHIICLFGANNFVSLMTARITRQILQTFEGMSFDTEVQYAASHLSIKEDDGNRDAAAPRLLLSFATGERSSRKRRGERLILRRTI